MALPSAHKDDPRVWEPEVWKEPKHGRPHTRIGHVFDADVNEAYTLCIQGYLADRENNNQDKNGRKKKQRSHTDPMGALLELCTFAENGGYPLEFEDVWQDCLRNFTTALHDAILAADRKGKRSANLEDAWAIPNILSRLPCDIPCNPLLEAYRVDTSDPRTELHGALGVRVRSNAKASLPAGSFVGVYRGRLAFQCRTNAPKLYEIPEGMDFDDYVLKINSYACDILNFNVRTVLEQVYGFKIPPSLPKNTNGIMTVSTYSAGGNLCCLVNDPTIHPPNQDPHKDLEWNTFVAEVLIGDWPYLIMFTGADIKPGEDLRYRYGEDYWTNLNILLEQNRARKEHQHTSRQVTGATGNGDGATEINNNERLGLLDAASGDIREKPDETFQALADELWQSREQVVTSPKLGEKENEQSMLGTEVQEMEGSDDDHSRSIAGSTPACPTYEDDEEEYCSPQRVYSRKSTTPRVPKRKREEIENPGENGFSERAKKWLQFAKIQEAAATTEAALEEKQEEEEKGEALEDNTTPVMPLMKVDKSNKNNKTVEQALKIEGRKLASASTIVKTKRALVWKALASREIFSYMSSDPLGNPVLATPTSMSKLLGQLKDNNLPASLLIIPHIDRTMPQDLKEMLEIGPEGWDLGSIASFAITEGERDGVKLLEAVEDLKEALVHEEEMKLKLKYVESLKKQGYKYCSLDPAKEKGKNDAAGPSVMLVPPSAAQSPRRKKGVFQKPISPGKFRQLELMDFYASPVGSIPEQQEVVTEQDVIDMTNDD